MDEPQLRDRISYLEEENRQLREALNPAVNPFAGKLGLPRQQAALLNLLYSRSFATHAALEGVMAQCSRQGSVDKAHDFQNRVKVAICKLRSVIDPLGVQIITVPTQGYSIDAANKDKLSKLLEASK